MLHYDASGSDAGSRRWFDMPGARYAAYHYLVWDDGTYFTMGPPGSTPETAYFERMYHAGKGRPSAAFVEHGETYPAGDGNSALIGIAVSATVGDRSTPRQYLAVAALCLDVFRRERWDPASELWRITGHEDESPGRKQDPTGPDPANPVLSKRDVRFLVSKLATQRAA